MPLPTDGVTFGPMAEAETQLALGGEKLDAALRIAACKHTPEAREAVYRTLLECDLLVPVKELPESLMGVVTEIEAEKFPSVLTIIDTQGRTGFPLFTKPARLEAFALSVGWSQEGKPQLYVALPARFAYTVAFASLATVIVVDPGGPFPFEGTLEEAGIMARGDCPQLVPQAPVLPPVEPDPPPARAVQVPVFEAAPEQPTPTAVVKTAPEPAPAARIGPTVQKPSFAVPDRLAGVLKVVLEQHPAVLMAFLYEQAQPQGTTLIFALKFDPPRDEVPPPLRKNLTTSLKRFLPGREVSIEVLSGSLEGLVLAATRPVYCRAGA